MTCWGSVRRATLSVLAATVVALSVLAEPTAGAGPPGRSAKPTATAVAQRATAPVGMVDEGGLSPGSAPPRQAASFGRPVPPLRPPSPSVSVPERAEGTFTVAGGSQRAPSTAAPGRATRTYQVEVEDGLSLRPRQIATFVDETLLDPRGWSAGGYDLQRVDSGASLRIVVASPETTDQLCLPLQTGGRLSCRNGATVALNAWRWVNGAEGYTSIKGYRRYLVNHEVGHALGYSHAACPGKGERAPAMMQQTKGLLGCTPNPWPSGVDLP